MGGCCAKPGYAELEDTGPAKDATTVKVAVGEPLAGAPVKDVEQADGGDADGNAAGNTVAPTEHESSRGGDGLDEESAPLLESAHMTLSQISTPSTSEKYERGKGDNNAVAPPVISTHGTTASVAHAGMPAPPPRQTRVRFKLPTPSPSPGESLSSTSEVVEDEQDANQGKLREQHATAAAATPANSSSTFPNASSAQHTSGAVLPPQYASIAASMHVDPTATVAPSISSAAAALAKVLRGPPPVAPRRRKDDKDKEHSEEPTPKRARDTESGVGSTETSPSLLRSLTRFRPHPPRRRKPSRRQWGTWRPMDESDA